MWITGKQYPNGSIRTGSESKLEAKDTLVSGGRGSFFLLWSPIQARDACLYLGQNTQCFCPHAVPCEACCSAGLCMLTFPSLERPLAASVS